MRCRNLIKNSPVYFGKTGHEINDHLWYKLNGQPAGKYQCGTTKPDEAEIGGETYAIEWTDINPLNGVLIKDETAVGVCTFTTDGLQNNYASGVSGTISSITQRLSVIKGELWYQINHGLPLLEKHKNKDMIDAAILEIISRHPDVLGIPDYKSEIENHTYSFSCMIDTVYGSSSLFDESTDISTAAICGLAIVGKAIVGQGV